MRAPADLTLVAEHRCGHGAVYDALNSGNIDVPRLRQVLAGLPMPQAADGRLVLAVDVSNWLRPEVPTSAERLSCHVYGRSRRSSDQFIPGWPYSFVAALESGRTSWCQPLDAVRLGPDDDVAKPTAPQVRRMRTDRVMRKSVTVSWISPPQGERPPKHGKEFRFAKPETPGEIRTRRRSRSPTGTEPPARWHGTASTPA